MNFQGVELAAMTKLAQMMVNADGVVDKKELAVIAVELMRFGVTREEAEDIVHAADAFNVEDIVPTIKAMGKEEKKYIGAYLATIMASDGQIVDAEVKMWNVISLLCGIPDMSVTEALELLKNLK